METEQVNDLTDRVIGAAIAVHRELGPGLEEADYELALATELNTIRIEHVCQQPIPVVYKGIRLDAGYRIDVLVENTLILELKAVETLHPVHEAQLLTYLRLSGLKIGLMLNFDVAALKEGIRRRVMGLEEAGVEMELRTTQSSDSPEMSSVSDSLSSQLLNAAIEIHRQLGPGLLRSAYEECLCCELSTRGIVFERRKELAVTYPNVTLPKSATIDLVVAGRLPLMLISSKEITPLTEARFIGRLRNGGWDHGIIFNFGQRTLSKGLKRIVNPNLKPL